MAIEITIEFGFMLRQHKLLINQGKLVMMLFIVIIEPQ